TANPMNEAEASKISLYTVADYMWNSDAYEPMESWKRSLQAFAGDSYQALKTFAENSFSSPLQEKESLTLTPLIEEFWKAYEAGNAETAGNKLIAEFTNVRNAPDQLRESLDKQNFLEEVSPYLDKLELYGKAGVAAVKMLMAESGGDGEAAWQQRQILEQALEASQEIPKRIAVGVIKPFLQKAVSENNDWLGIVGQHAGTSMGTYESYSISNMTDGDSSTLYWSDGSPNPGDAVSVDLGAVYTIQSIELLMGSTAGSVPRPDDYIHHGVLQYSRTGRIWRTIMQGDEQREIRLDLDGIKARYIRYKATANQNNWVQVREFQVVSDKGSVQVMGGPSADDQTSFAAAADGNIMTAYRADRVPKKEEALTFTYSKAGKLDQVVILQDTDSAVEANVQILNENGEWLKAGTLSGGFSKVDVGLETKSIRLVWQGGSVPPVIYELIPKWQHQNPNVITPEEAVASSSETDWLTPDNAIDMDPATRWSSGRTDNEWIYVDLGEEYMINAVKLDWEAAYGKGYKIQVSSDKENWTTVYSTTTGDGGIDKIQFDEVNARYVRMLGTDRATSYGYSLWGFQVFQAGFTS
ncbi:MAG TPA: discoidin domain-containing protein, partial [Bacillales bacterium]